MAEREFRIVIRNETSVSGAASKIGGAGGLVRVNEGGELSKLRVRGTLRPKKTPAEKTQQWLAKKALGLVSYGAISSAVNRIVSVNNSLIQVRTGSHEQQEETSYIYNNVSSLANSVIGGALGGATIGGGIGAAVGATLGLVSSVAGFGMNYLQQKYVLSENKGLETMTKQLTTQRVTVSGSRYMNATQV